MLLQRFTPCCSRPSCSRPSLLATLLALTALASACGPGLVDPTDHKGPPVTVLSADVQGALSGGMPAGAVRGALLWSAYDAALLACLDAVPDFEVPLDPYNDPADDAVASQLSLCLTLHLTSTVESDSVGLEPTFPASFEIPLFSLPDPSLLTGPPSARLGLAAVDVYVDGNENGALDLVAPGTVTAADTVIGSSAAVSEDDRVHALVVYREGALSSLWKLYRAIYDCPAEPPQGFSVMTIEINEDFTAVTCTLSDGPISVRLADSDAMRREVCLPNAELGAFVEATADASIPGGASITCEDGVAYFSSDPAAICPLVGHYDLYGCRDTSSEAACRASLFDHTAEPPAWWPCTGGSAVFWPSETFATAGLDQLGEVHVRGSAMFELSDLTLEVETGDGFVTLGAGSLALIDNDGNGWANAGDAVEVRETTDLFNPDSEPGQYAVHVLLRGERIAQSGYSPVPLPQTELPRHVLEVLDAPGTTSTDGELLFSVRSVEGEGTYAREDLSLTVWLFGKAPERMPDDMLTLIDTDGDDRFGAGDTIEVRMTASVSEWARAQLHDQNGNFIHLEVRTGVNITTTITGGEYGSTTWGRFTVRLEPLTTPFSDALDDVCTVVVMNAPAFSLQQLTAYWSASRDNGDVLVQREIDASWFIHDDVDGDGLISRGDTLLLREAEEVLSTDAPVAGGYHSLYLTAPDGSSANTWGMLRGP